MPTLSETQQVEHFKIPHVPHDTKVSLRLQGWMHAFGHAAIVGEVLMSLNDGIQSVERDSDEYKVFKIIHSGLDKIVLRLHDLEKQGVDIYADARNPATE
jgi:hypothetical protein